MTAFWEISGIVAWSLLIGAVLLFLILAALNRSHGIGECPLCVEANIWPYPTWEPGAVPDIAYLLVSQWHKRVLAKLPPHRRAWQAMYDTAGDFKRARLAKAQPRYGVRSRPRG